MVFWQWIFLSLLTPFLWAAANVGDRYLSLKTVRNEYAMTFVSCMLRLPIMLVFWAIADFYVPPFKLFLITLLQGSLLVFPFLFYYRALQKEETPRVMLLYYSTGPIMVYVLSALFLGERIGSYDLLGFLLLLLAAVLSVIRFQKGFFRFHVGAFWILLSGILWSVQDVLLKYLTPMFPTSWSLLAWMQLGGFLAGFFLLLFPEFKRHCWREHFKWSRLSWIIFLIDVVIFTIGTIAFVRAVALERIALTIVLASTQPLFVFFIELVAQRFLPEHEKLDTSVPSILAKAASFCMMLFGIWLFTL